MRIQKICGKAMFASLVSVVEFDWSLRKRVKIAKDSLKKRTNLLVRALNVVITQQSAAIFKEWIMRKSYSNQLRLDCLPIEQVTLNLECRDEIVPVLAGLQHLYSQQELRDHATTLIASDINV